MASGPQHLRLVSDAPHLKCDVPGIPVYTVYSHPSDYPNNFVVRLFINDQPTNAVFILDRVEQVDELLLGFGLYRRGRMIGDDDNIVETWHLPEWAMATIAFEGQEEALRQLAFRKRNPPRKLNMVDDYGNPLVGILCHHCGGIAEIVPPGVQASLACPDCEAMEDLGWL